MNKSCLTEELKNALEELEKSNKEKLDLENQLKNLKIEINDVNTAAALSESAKHEEIGDIQYRYQEEITSLQSIMKGKLSLIR